MDRLRRMRLVRAFALMLVTLGVTFTGFAANAPKADAALTTTQVQWNLATLGYLTYSGVDGSYGPKTKSAVMTFQGNRCLTVDGSAGPITQTQLINVVKAVQAKVGTTQDGLGGPKTKAAIIAYQKRNGLVADGMAGPATMAKMGIARVLNCGSMIVGDPTADSSGVACPAGTVNLGVHAGYRNGYRIGVRLCQIPNLRSIAAESNPNSAYYIPGANGKAVVNSRVAKGAYHMAAAANAAGRPLTVTSGFRSMKHQSALCQGDYNCRNGINYYKVAKPGWSNHQSGAALDFQGMYVFKSGATCANRATAWGSPQWVWLNSNARKYGFKQNAMEAWHWDPTPGRC